MKTLVIAAALVLGSCASCDAAKPKATAKPKAIVNAAKLCNQAGEACKKCDAKRHRAEWCKPDPQKGKTP